MPFVALLYNKNQTRISGHRQRLKTFAYYLWQT